MTSEATKHTVQVDMLRSEAGDDIALVTINNPPLNLASTRVRQDLLGAIESVCRDEVAIGVILTGANGNFVAGADIREFDFPPQEPHMPQVVAAIEDCPVPVVAAISGAALGGGFELALGCDARLATDGATIGLPEVFVGLIPGGGATQRLPRLIGIAKSIEVITSGRRVEAEEAAKLGLIDAVVHGDLLTAAIDHLQQLSGKKRPLLSLPVHRDSPEDIEKAELEALKKGRGADAVSEAIRVIKLSARLTAEDALNQEREASLRLRRGPQSQALRYLFFAERSAAKLPLRAVPRDVKKVGIVGGGAMGRGIAIAFALHDYEVSLCEGSRDLLSSALEGIRGIAHTMADKGLVSSADDLIARISGIEIEAMADRDLIIEAIKEDMTAKKAVFERIDKIAGPDAVLASNTSYLNIDEIASAITKPERVAGLHFFNPAHLMRLAEVVRAERTSPEALSTLLAVAKRLGKVPVVATVSEGFIGNRIFNAYRRQSEFLIEEGAYPQDVDRAMRDFGMAMGPFAVFDLAGLDIAWATRKRLMPQRDPQARYVHIPDRLCEAGRFGRKTGKGWYDYTSSPRGTPDPAVAAIIERASAEKGITRRVIPDQEIQDRLLAAIINEAAIVLAEGVASRPSDIDLVLVHGYGFPALKGGPLHWAKSQPREQLLSSIRTMATASGKGVEVAENMETVLSAVGST